MKVPLSWLREFVEVAGEPARLAEDLTLAGLAVDAVDSQGTETVFDFDITTNRVDCMNVYGVAREVAVLYGLRLEPLDLSFTEKGSPAGEALSVAIEAPDLCPRFCGRVLDVKLGPSPSWLRDRLELVGVRAINNLVDLTNYVMMEMGHPSHAFDLDQVPQGRITVRWAREGEKLVTLDGVERVLSSSLGVVAGPQAALALAGIMGGASSEVSDGTSAVALEAAYWEPLVIRRGAKGLGMRTEASHRFERGADPEAPPRATARLAHLLQKIGAGTTRPGLIDRVAAPRPRRSFVFRPARVESLLGTSVPEARWRGILSGLGFTLGAMEGDGLSLEVPSWRGDVSGEADVIEEVARHHGLDKVPTSLPSTASFGGLTSGQKTERRIREVLVGAGLTEVVSLALVSEVEAQPSPGPRLPLENPLADVQGVLRTSLVIPGLLCCLRTNLRHGRRDLRIFELGRVFRGDLARPTEETRLGMLLTGPGRPPHWSEAKRSVDFFDVKGLLELLFRRLGLAGFELGREGLPGYLHPGKSALLSWQGRSLGYAGVLHPDLLATWELREEAVVGELNLEPILGTAATPAKYEVLPRFPAVARDLSVLCGQELDAKTLEDWIRAAAGPLLAGVTVSDRYDRPPVPEGKVSLTLGLRYQHGDRTLTSEEVQGSVEAVVTALRSRGAEIRGE
jgi:phenylalanyl-tRNA synthetase beta chain